MVNWNGCISRWALFPKDWLIHVFADSGVGGVVLAIRRFRAMPSTTRLLYSLRVPCFARFVTRLWLYISDVIHTKKLLSRKKVWVKLPSDNRDRVLKSCGTLHTSSTKKLQSLNQPTTMPGEFYMLKILRAIHQTTISPHAINATFRELTLL